MKGLGSSIFLKMGIGVLLIIASLYWMVKGSQDILNISWWQTFVVVANGSLPVLVLLLGAFIVWLYYDEWKIEQELKAEEEKLKKEEKTTKSRKKK